MSQATTITSVSLGVHLLAIGYDPLLMPLFPPHPPTTARHSDRRPAFLLPWPAGAFGEEAARKVLRRVRAERRHGLENGVVEVDVDLEQHREEMMAWASQTLRWCVCSRNWV